MVNRRWSMVNGGARLCLWLALALLGALLPPALPAHAQTYDDEIVYLDGSGVIRVRDLNQVGGRAFVQWESPQKGFVDFTLADVNGDGDQEIIGLRAEGEEARLEIYDPVIASGVFDPNQTINGIPWGKLYELSIPANPALVGAGELDVSVSGVELLYSYRVQTTSPEGGTTTRQRFRILRATGAYDGRSWQESEIPFDSDNWSSLAIGDMDESGADEVALVSRATGTLSIYRLLDDGGIERIFTNQSNSRVWHHAAMGRWVANSRVRLGAVRNGPLGLPSLFVVRYSLENQDIREDYTEAFEPSPEYAFFADVNGNGDDELFMVRFAPSTQPDRSRLFMRKNPNSTGVAITFDDKLDADNGYRVGAGGDVDGDGKDEIAVMRNNRIRYYLTPDVSTAFSEESLETDGQHIVMGDLDRNGYLQELRLSTSTTRVEETARSGAAAPPATLLVTNGVNTESIPFAWAIDGNPSWVTVVATGDRTPATLTIRFSASDLREGLYTANLLLTSSHPLVFQQPTTVELRFTVTAGMIAIPPSLTFVQYPCTEPFAIQSQAAQLDARAGVSYTVFLLDEDGVEQAAANDPDTPLIDWPSSVPWASAFSENGVAPESLTISVDFAKRVVSFDQAQAIIAATVDGESVVRKLEIVALCADHQLFLPVVAQAE